MGVFKEEIISLEDLCRKQVRIYPDSCDYGVLATGEVKETMRRVLKSLMALDGNHNVRKVDRPMYVQRDYKLAVYWSDSEATIADVSYINDKRGKKEYFTIKFSQHLQ